MSRLIGTAPLASPPLITLASRCSAGGGVARLVSGGIASGTSPWSGGANVLYGFPFVIDAPTTFYKGFWLNGSSAGNNFEVGIWDDAFAKIVTTGSVAATGNSVPQSAAFASSVTPTLPPGLYYAGIAHNATTTNQIFRFPVTTAGFYKWESLGCWGQASITLGSLAATATPANSLPADWPVYGLITRSVFDV